MVWVKINPSLKQSTLTFGFTQESNHGLLCESPVSEPFIHPATQHILIPCRSVPVLLCHATWRLIQMHKVPFGTCVPHAKPEDISKTCKPASLPGCTRPAEANAWGAYHVGSKSKNNQTWIKRLSCWCEDESNWKISKISDTTTNIQLPSSLQNQQRKVWIVFLAELC